MENVLEKGHVRATALDALRNMDAYEFEHLVADVWRAKGWDAGVSTASNDAGVDVTATRDHPYQQKILIQAKRYGADTAVGSPEVQQYASLRQHERDVDAAVIVTTSSFTSSGKEMAERLNVKCVNGQALLDIIHEADAVDVLTDYLPRFEAYLAGEETDEIRDKEDYNPESEIPDVFASDSPPNENLGLTERLRLASTGTQLVLTGALAHAVPLLISDLSPLILLGAVAVPAGVILDARNSSDWQKRGYLYAAFGWMFVFGALIGALYVYRRIQD